MRSLREEHLGPVIDRVYEAAGRSELWPVVLDEVNTALGGTGTILIPGPTSPFAPAFTEWFAEPVDFATRHGLFEHNPRITRGIKVAGPRDILTESMIFSPWELDHHPYNAEMGPRFGLRWFAGMMVADFGLSGLYLNVERGPDQERFSHREIELLRRMVPHVQRAGQLTVRLARARADGVLDGLAALDCGGLLLSAAGVVIGENAQARRHLGPGLTLRLGRLAAVHAASNDTLQRLLGTVLRPGPAHEAPAAGAVAIVRPLGRPLVIHAAPIVGAASDVFQAAKAIVMVVDPDEHREPAALVLRQTFGLTLAEAETALLLARGLDLDEIARMRAVSGGTVRQQIKAVFAKTATRRQAELVALVLRLSPTLRARR